MSKEKQDELLQKYMGKTKIFTGEEVLQELIDNEASQRKLSALIYVKQALQSPRITREEIVKELNEHLKLKCAYFEDINKFVYLDSDGYCEICFYNVNTKTINWSSPFTFPIKTIHKITTFFMQEVE